MIACAGCSGSVTANTAPDAVGQDAFDEHAQPDAGVEADAADALPNDGTTEPDAADASLEADAAPDADATAPDGDAAEVDAEAEPTDAQEEESGSDAADDADAFVGLECGYFVCGPGEICKQYVGLSWPVCVPPIEAGTTNSPPVCPPASQYPGGCPHTPFSSASVCDGDTPACVPIPASCGGGFTCDCVPSEFCFGSHHMYCDEANLRVECPID